MTPLGMFKDVWPLVNRAQSMGAAHTIAMWRNKVNMSLLLITVLHCEELTCSREVIDMSLIVKLWSQASGGFGELKNSSPLNMREGWRL